MKMGKRSWTALVALAAGVWGCNGLVGADPPILAEESDGEDGAGSGNSGGAAGSSAGPGGEAAGGSGEGGFGSGEGGFGSGEGGFGSGEGGSGSAAAGGAGGAAGGCNPQNGTGCVCLPGTTTPCYTGPAGTEGTGICHAGAQTCAADGLGYGPCEGEQVPKAEVCDATKLDEDCDAQVNEGAQSCSCGDGVVAPGEACDDGDADSADECTAQCKLPACGDGFVQAGAGEECDDGGVADGDLCSPTCKVQKVLQVEAGDTHVCALLSDGKVKCWGHYLWLGVPDDGGENHRGDEPGEMGANLPYVDLGTGVVAVQIAVGGNHTCARLSDGKVKCWGNNGHGRLGLGDVKDRGLVAGQMGDNLPAVDLGVGQTAKSITAGDDHTCALLDSGLVKCWGANGHGQLGLGNTTVRGDQPGEMGANLPAVKLGSNLTVAELSAGGTHTCARFTNGRVKCWGGNGWGQLGLGHTDPQGDQNNEMGDDLAYVKLGTGKKATSISAGYGYTCAALDDGTAKCWGGNDSGQLGQGSTQRLGDQAGEMGDNLKAIKLGVNVHVVSVSTASGVGTKHHACARLITGYVKCWGANNRGQLGRGSTTQIGDEPGEMGGALSPIDLGTGKKVVSVSLGASKLLLQNGSGEYVGSGYTCAVLEDGSAKCWGRALYGLLGQGNQASRGDNPGEMGDALLTTKLFTSDW